MSSLDLFGVKPLSESINKVTSAGVDGVSGLLSRICYPAAEEFGLWMRDRVHDWRINNLAAIARKAEHHLSATSGSTNFHAHPRLVFKILEEGSWIDDDLVQEAWGGLLASSCTESGLNDSNLIFTSILSSLTNMQVRILDFACKQAQKVVAGNGLVSAMNFSVPLDVLRDISQEDDIYRLDRELDHLRGLELIHSGFMELSASTDADIAPSALALQLFVRCNGSRKSPLEFFGLPKPV